eukprot:TRINITY_DN40620_c0_g1_i1.p1 TRINITY_DN40620_c0_g1~~TRINITY_DN40620_c0_g1_i1.p1  ORF type:complete len:355 (-),score=75.89 TRINITY_DN40620_c0_g1_i1:189-1253(-)
MGVQGGFTQAALDDTNAVLNDFLRPLLTSFPMFFLGLACMAQYHLVPFLGWRRGPLLRMFGQGLVVLQLYSDPELKGKYPFVLSCFLVFFDQVVIQGAVMSKLEGNHLIDFEFLGLRATTENMVHVLKEERRADVDEFSDMVVKNKYMDPSVPSRRISLLFIGQLGLMCYFIYTLNDDDDSHDINKINFVKWGLALILTMCVDDDEAGAVYVKSYWIPDSFMYGKAELRKVCIFEHPIAIELADKAREIFMFVSIPHGIDWKLRRYMDALINVLFRTVIMATAPMLLCTEEPIDFIKDCLALFFISKLDDLDDCRSLTQALKECYEQAKTFMPDNAWRSVEDILAPYEDLLDKA